MRNSVKLILSALAASLLLASAVSTASARNLSISNQNIRATWQSLEFNGGALVRCQVTLEGSFHTRTIAKIPGSLIGWITKAQVKQETCTNGTGAPFNGVERYNGTTTPNTLPWHLTYHSFTGRLPNIEVIRLLLRLFRFGITVPGICTGQYGIASDNVVANAFREGGGISSIEPLEGSNIATLSRRDGGIFCPETGRLQNRGLVMLLGNTTRITITLI